MNNITWKYVKKLNDPDVVTEFLKKNHVILPAALVECLVQNNGGRPSEKDFSTNKGEGYVCKNLLSFNEKDKESVYKFYPDMFRGTTLFPFAMDASGNFVCYDMKKRKYVLWKHETDSVEIIKY